ncbi:MAG: FIST C-terminal domain-containing protein [candidate division Zixibacteria bacterium]|nr:FIST C-terminal domain-containing protein [candidate division Zixibacteria bacterium]
MITTETKTSVIVKRGYSCLPDEAQAVKEFYNQIYHPEMTAVVIFASSKLNLDKLGNELKQAFTVPVIGCSTSGEITPDGYREGSLTGFSLTSEKLKVLTYNINPLDNLNTSQIQDIGTSVKQHLSEEQKKDANAKAFGLFLIDGLSVMEEIVIANLYSALGNIPLIGGSAGDDIAFKKTCIYSDGQFISNMATVTLIITSLPFETFKIQHFTPTDKKLVITQAIPSLRVVKEINGKPAAWEYARLIGLKIDELEPMVFSKYPVMLKIGGEYYVRSIQKTNDDGSLTFFCAIDEGLVLTLSKSSDLVSHLESSLADISQKVPNPQLIIGFECILRRLEVIEKDLASDVGKIMKRHNVVGFHTYGEQYNSIHVNQTFTGVVIGS